MSDITHLFTPRYEDGTRLHMQISSEDRAKILRGKDWSATVTDLTTGKRYSVIAAECSAAHCYCDALIVDEVIA